MTQNIDDMVDSLEHANELEDIKLLQGGKDLFQKLLKILKKNMKALEDVKKK